MPTLEGRTFTNHSLVAYYLNLFSYWWNDPANGLYKKETEARTLLIYWLKHNKEPNEELSHEMIYVLNHFQNDFLPHFDLI